MTDHDLGDVAALATGLLRQGQQDHRVTNAHLSICAACRAEFAELRDVDNDLRSVQPEMFIDGPASQLLMRRVMHSIDADVNARRRPSPRRVARLLAAAVLVVVVVAGAGVVVGRWSAPPTEIGVLAGPEFAEPAAAVARGNADWRGNHVGLTAAITPRAGWVQVAATVAGLPAGQRCTLVLVASDGSVRPVAEWIVGADGSSEGTQLFGSAILDPASITRVEVRDADGTVPITVPIT